MTRISQHLTSDPVPQLSESDLKSYAEHSNSVQEKLKTTLCCPEIKNIHVDILPSCNKCHQTLVVLPNKRIVTCQFFNSTMKAEKCPKKFNCKLSIDDKVFTLPLPVVEHFFQRDIIRWCNEDVDSFKEGMLFLQGIDFTFFSKYFITKMENH